MLVVGIVHIEAYSGPYSGVPTIGELFLANFVAATVIGVSLVLPIERLAGRWGGVSALLAITAGIALAAGSLVMLIISEHGTLFGFHEPGYDPEAISRSRVAEVAAVGLLSASIVLRRLSRSRPRW
jgi:hypothetical protein